MTFFALFLATSLAATTPHSCPAAPGVWRSQGSEYRAEIGFNRLDVGSQRQRWNGSPVTEQELQVLIAKVRANPSNMVLVVEPQATCAEITAARVMINSAVRCGAQFICVEYAR